ncbi:hypothetical protein ACFSSC_07745 [Corynebacterium mendelii]|uniref:Uncharacterized protein n=1 Tax=Corynebacterium mendelii TaxID=2765362 RepID=A0A939E146_9CORY|nr:hypothetical protein [Corynebacterium mendelii]MBN9644773.1 hypothetical protein [Corynebacterium mendelii]
MGITKEQIGRYREYLDADIDHHPDKFANSYIKPGVDLGYGLTAAVDTELFDSQPPVLRWEFLTGDWQKTRRCPS